MKTLVAFVMLISVVPCVAKDAIVNFYGWDYSEEELRSLYESLSDTYTVYQGQITKVRSNLIARLKGKVLQVVDETTLLLIAENLENSTVCVQVPTTEDLIDDQYIEIPVKRDGKYSYMNVQNVKKNIARYTYLKIVSPFTFEVFFAEARRSLGKSFPEIAQDVKEKFEKISEKDREDAERQKAATKARIQQRNAWITGSNFRDSKR